MWNWNPDSKNAKVIYAASRMLHMSILKSVNIRLGGYAYHSETILQSWRSCHGKVPSGRNQLPQKTDLSNNIRSYHCSMQRLNLRIALNRLIAAGATAHSRDARPAAQINQSDNPPGANTADHVR
jgi:hypothetical protein